MGHLRVRGGGRRGRQVVSRLLRNVELRKVSIRQSPYCPSLLMIRKAFSCTLDSDDFLSSMNLCGSLQSVCLMSASGSATIPAHL